MIDSITNSLTFADVTAEDGLKKALDMGRADVITLISDSGLRGRGGAGFPTGVKWNLTASAKSDRKYVVCNADEGEPGTFKDRVILTRHADLVFEGMTIAAYAIGAAKGYLYLRAEYTYLLAHLEEALARRMKNNLLGADILGNDKFSFDIEIRMGAGAYICGEETALIESMEGYRGEPRNRPPFPVDTGFERHPTTVNNVETFAWAACALSRGADWFAKIGTGKSKGLKIFSVSGDCVEPGVYELPLGVTIKELLVKVGGEEAKAVQVGGASGFCVSAKNFDRKIAFEDVMTGGSIIVFGPERDMLKVARNFLEFFADESCGQCTPCREGNVQLLDGVESLLRGKCSSGRLKDLLGLAETMRLCSKCGLGQSSPNAFVSIMENFKDDVTGREFVNHHA